MRVVVPLMAALALTACSDDGGAPTAIDTPSASSSAYDVAGHALWGECVEGEPPYVIYLHGLGGSSGDLTGLAETVAAADPDRGWCRYDRLNAGRSASDLDARELSESVEELSGFLEAAAVEGPVVLVGHSFGGLLASAYAGAHADRVAGLVFADAALPFELELFDERVDGTIRAISTSNREHVDLLAAYQAAAAAGPLPEVPFVYVDAAKQDLPTDWGVKGYRAALARFVRAHPQGELVTSATDHVGVLSSPELADAVIDVAGR